MDLPQAQTASVGAASQVSQEQVSCTNFNFVFIYFLMPGQSRPEYSQSILLDVSLATHHLGINTPLSLCTIVTLLQRPLNTTIHSHQVIEVSSILHQLLHYKALHQCSTFSQHFSTERTFFDELFLLSVYDTDNKNHETRLPIVM